MYFLKEGSDSAEFKDNVFKYADMAAKDKSENKINATIGSLCDENGQLVAFKSFFKIYDDLPDTIKAKYASAPKGNEGYLKAVKDFVLEDKITLPISINAASGGTGAITLAFKNIPDFGDSVLIPETAWGNYELMAKEYGLKTIKYDIYDLDDLIAKTKEAAQRQKRVMAVINSPCHNPCGLSLSKDDFHKLIEAFKAIPKPVIILNDIAYIDYSFDLDHNKDYLETFNDIDDKMMIIIAFSLSKTMTSYGLRCGADIIITKDEKTNEAMANVFEKSSRALWSNINNAAMTAFEKVIKDHKEEFLKEKAQYIELLKKRSELFLSEAKTADLPLYPYDEGFFITLKVKDNETRDLIHERLLNDHIYAVPVNKGIRIAICSIPLEKIKGLAQRIKKAF